MITIATMIASFIVLARAVRTIPLGTARAVWTGIGAAGTAVLGALPLKEPVTPARVLCLAPVEVGTVG